MKTRKVPVRARRKEPSVSRAPIVWTCVAIGIAILVVYSQTFGYGFVSFDDGTYVYQNQRVITGLSLQNLGWAFTTFYASNWHPLTWVSFMVDCAVFGLSPGEQHAVNVMLHLGSSILLFLVLERMTLRRWRSAAVAGIFALHPLHVESVAWIAERKDVLSTFFEMLTLWFYVRFTEDSKPVRYAAMTAAFALSLLSKPMAVTLPFVMILLDAWPLRRWRPWWEKAPLFALSAAACVLTWLAQREAGAMNLSRLGFTDRLANAAVDYVRYIAKFLWPVNLAVLYPLEKSSPLMVFASVMTLAAVSAAAVLAWRRRPYVLVGWLWFLGMLVPVIGLVQVGFQSIADRYTYVPLVGLSIALVWAMGDLVEAKPDLRQAVAAAAEVVLLALSIGTYRQTQYWKNSIGLFEHTLAVTHGNYVIHNNLGIELQSAGRLDEAAGQFRQAVAAAPEYKDALNSLGAILAYQGNKEGAIELYRRAVAADPNYSTAHINLGHTLMETGQPQEAIVELTRGVRLEPNSARAHGYLGALLANNGNLEEARKHLEESLRLAPKNAEAQNNLCSVLQSLGRPEQAIAACEAALKMRPNLVSAQFNLAKALAGAGQTDAAIEMLSRMLAVNPNNSAARATLENLQRSKRR